jgi:hypothetical protein
VDRFSRTHTREHAVAGLVPVPAPLPDTATAAGEVRSLPLAAPFRQLAASRHRQRLPDPARNVTRALPAGCTLGRLPDEPVRLGGDAHPQHDRERLGRVLLWPSCSHAVHCSTISATKSRTDLDLWH